MKVAQQFNQLKKHSPPVIIKVRSMTKIRGYSHFNSVSMRAIKLVSADFYRRGARGWVRIL